jgi:hypothetical protein
MSRTYVKWKLDEVLREGFPDWIQLSIGGKKYKLFRDDFLYQVICPDGKMDEDVMMLRYRSIAREIEEEMTFEEEEIES